MKKLLIIVFMLFLAGISVLFFVVPAYQKSVRLEKNIAQKEKEYASKIAYYDKITALIQEIDLRAGDLSKIDGALPTENSYAKLLYFLQVKAGEGGLVIKSINFQNSTSSYSLPANKNQTVKNVIMTMNVSGSYQNLKKFLGLLDNSVRLFQVNSINFTPLDGKISSKDQNKITNRDISLEIQTYTY